MLGPDTKSKKTLVGRARGWRTRTAATGENFPLYPRLRTKISDSGQKPSPTRRLEMLSDRFSAFEAIANSSIKLARVPLEEELAMEPLVAEALLEFAEDLRGASQAATTWVNSCLGSERCG